MRISIFARCFSAFFFLGGLLAGQQAEIQETLPHEEIYLQGQDNTNGMGGEITLLINLPPSLAVLGSGEKVGAIVLERSREPDGAFLEVGRFEPGQTRFLDHRDVRDGISYFYRARVLLMDRDPILTRVAGPFSSEGRWFKPGSLLTFIMAGLVVAAMVLFLGLAKSGRSMYIRPIPGLKAVDEAIGRATEMGKPVLYCSGVADLRCPGVIASMTVLGWVAEKAARFGCDLTFPVNNALTLTAGQEIVKEGFLRAGRPERYHDDMVYFISGEQFAYAAAVCGVMERERPAANFFFGSFWSETLVLTESGAATGAMQIAAVDTEHQIPFMVATCDYVIIGEEFYAASAYLSEDANIKGTLKAQDLIKALIVLLILAGVLFSTLEAAFHLNMDWFFSIWER
jgi:hypothetical protein